MRKCTDGFIAGSVPRRRAPQSEWTSCDVLVFLQFAQHVQQPQRKRSCEQPAALAGFFLMVSRNKVWLSGYSTNFVLKIWRSDIYLASCPWDVRRNGFRSSCAQCTASTGVTKLRGTFLQLPVENRHIVYTVQAEVPVFRIAKEIHKQSFHDCTERKRRHRAPKQLQRSALMLWFQRCNGPNVGLVVPVTDISSSTQ